ncbi:hypothetical protein BDV93DRAFT_315633 [Ceratobasidium sp. AG-I]|nr:hypothetical protein BDV93DRAFT_315633 [Ceratobasidium sp. AG-I]
MGKSAKLHKRKGKSSSSAATNAKSQSNSAAPQPQPLQRTAKSQSNSAAAQPQPLQRTAKASETKTKAEKLRDMKAKSKLHREGHVLGGADYVTLMMGGRAKARQEAEKLPIED